MISILCSPECTNSRMQKTAVQQLQHQCVPLDPRDYLVHSDCCKGFLQLQKHDQGPRSRHKRRPTWRPSRRLTRLHFSKRLRKSGTLKKVPSPDLTVPTPAQSPDFLRLPATSCDFLRKVPSWEVGPRVRVRAPNWSRLTVLSPELQFWSRLTIFGLAQ